MLPYRSFAHPIIGPDARMGGSATDAAALPSRHIAAQGPLSMGNTHTNQYAPRPLFCPSCGKIMRFARTTSRFGDLPDFNIFECRACGVSRIRQYGTVAALPSRHITPRQHECDPL
jgi:hypothetical protein